MTDTIYLKNDEQLLLSRMMASLHIRRNHQPYIHTFSSFAQL